MKKQFLLISIMLGLMIDISGQTIDLTFTAVDNESYVQLDSIKVMNRTQWNSTMLYWPDTTLTYEITPGDTLLYIGYSTASSVGAQETSQEIKQFQLFQNYPNPVKDQSIVSMYIPENGIVNVMITDLQGEVFSATEWQLNKGNHLFRFTPGGDNLYFLTAWWKGISRSIKILTTETNTGKICTLDYTGSGNWEPQLKFSSLKAGFMQESGLLHSPTSNESYTFQFATNIPCPGIPTVTFEGQVYNTIQVFSQCWLKENLNAGSMIQGEEEMTDNGIIEKYCYNNEPDSCIKYGGLYQWNEMMQYTTQQGAQGICPPGWHIPTDEEWKLLEGAADSQIGMGDTTWDALGKRGVDAGMNLKTISGWNSNFGADLYDFSGLPGGRNVESTFYNVRDHSYWWVSTKYNDFFMYYRSFIGSYPEAYRPNTLKESGLSVRCVRDIEPTTESIDLTFTAIDNDSYVQLDSIKVMNRTHEGEKVLYYPDTTITLEIELANYLTGDQLLLVGYYDTLQSGMLDIPEEDKTYTFQFATNIPCPGTPTVEYEGQVYNTIQIFSQCWLKENLNVGTMIPGTQYMADNDTIEKYCYNNEPDSCIKYGGQYQWDEMMQYTTQQRTQGICPPDWHLPTDEEWKVLEGAVDSQYEIGDVEWDYSGYRGIDAGFNIKSSYGWTGNNNGGDYYGFSVLPGGMHYDTVFYGITWQANYWTTTSGTSSALNRHLSLSDDVYKNGYTFSHGFSIRCIKD